MEPRLPFFVLMCGCVRGQDAEGHSLWDLTWYKAHSISANLTPSLLADSGVIIPMPQLQPPPPPDHGETPAEAATAADGAAVTALASTGASIPDLCSLRCSRLANNKWSWACHDTTH